MSINHASDFLDDETVRRRLTFLAAVLLVAAVIAVGWGGWSEVWSRLGIGCPGGAVVLLVCAGAVFVVSRTGHDDHAIFLRIYGRELLPDGRADTSFVDIHPRLTTIELTSAPSGASLTVDGIPHTTPFKDTVLVGSDVVVSAPAEQIIKSIAQRLLFEPCFKPRAVGAPFLVALQITPLFQSGNKFKLSELRRLKTAGGHEAIAESKKVHRRHCLKHGHLTDKHALDLYRAPQQAVCR